MKTLLMTFAAAGAALALAPASAQVGSAYGSPYRSPYGPAAGRRADGHCSTGGCRRLTGSFFCGWPGWSSGSGR